MIVFIILGAPVWTVVGDLISFSYEISKSLDFGLVTVPVATLYTYKGTTVGFIWGAVSQLLKSRKKAPVLSLLSIILLAAWLLVEIQTSKTTYCYCFY